MSSIKVNVTNAFKKQHPDLNINYILDYDDDLYIVNATQKPNDDEELDPYYAVNKQSGEIYNFIPQFDDDSFFEAYENRRL